eukprot:jgi/Chlat1/9077/Chrsp94S08323
MSRPPPAKPWERARAAGASTSPPGSAPKPWERLGAGLDPSSSAAPSQLSTLPPSSTPGARPWEARSSGEASTSAITNMRTTTQQPYGVNRNAYGGNAYNSVGGYNRPYGGSTYGGYGGGGYGSSMGSSMYGGVGSSYGMGSSMYGGGGMGYGSSYGGMNSYGSMGSYGGYGGSMYGRQGMYGGMGGGYGMGGGAYGMGQPVLGPNGEPIDPNDPNHPANQGPPSAWASVLRSMHAVMSFFGRISMLVDENTHALHFFISALLQLADRAGVLYGELARFVLRLLGFRARRKAMQKAVLAGASGSPPLLENGPAEAPAGSPWDGVWQGEAKMQ